MTDYERLVAFFENREWYDYSRLRLMDACLRKGFYAFHGPAGIPLDQKVGPGASFGTCFHSGLAAYYSGWGKLSEQQRRHMAIRAFSGEYATFDFTNKRGVVPGNHKLERGLTILDAYFEKYLDEDSMLRPIDAELGFAVEISPEEGEDDFKPFTFVGRVDGVFLRTYDRKKLPRETKTCRSDAEGRLRQLNFNHQPVGYVSCLRMLPDGHDIDSFIGDTVVVQVEKLEFCRDYFVTTELQRRSWRRQTIRKVERWRKALSESQGKTLNEKLDIFTQNTEDCFSYGKCAFYELCDFGISLENLKDYAAATWNPLLQRPPEKVSIVADGQEDTITLAR